MERVLDLPQDVGWNGVKVIIPKPIVCTEKAGSDGSSIPAWGGEGVGNRRPYATRVQGADELPPAFLPPRKRNPRGTKKSGRVNS